MRHAHDTSLARDGTRAPALEVQSRNHWTAREVLRLHFDKAENNFFPGHARGGRMGLNLRVHPEGPLSFLGSPSYQEKVETFQKDYLETSRNKSEKQEMD